MIESIEKEQKLFYDGDSRARIRIHICILYPNNRKQFQSTRASYMFIIVEMAQANKLSFQMCGE